jgi:hypothetical protein
MIAYLSGALSEAAAVAAAAASGHDGNAEVEPLATKPGNSMWKLRALYPLGIMVSLGVFLSTPGASEDRLRPRVNSD